MMGEVHTGFTAPRDVPETAISMGARYSAWSSHCQSMSSLVLLAESELTPFLGHAGYISKDLFVN